MKRLLTIILALTSLILITSCGTKKVKVQKYIEVEYSPAYDGYAEPTLKINEEELNKFIDVKKVEKLYKEALKKQPDYEEYMEMMEEAGVDIEDVFEMYEDDIANFSEYFDIGFDERYENLSNGDKIVVNVTPRDDVAESFGMSTEKFMKRLGIKLSKEQIEIKVKGLEELAVAELNLGEMIEIDFGTYDGYSTPSATINTTYLRKVTIPEFVKDYANSKFGNTRALISEDYDWFDVEFDKAYSNIKNGDKITVNVVLNEELAEDGITLEELETELGIKLGKGSETFKVSGLEKPKNVIDVFEGVENFVVYRGGNGHGSIYSFVIPEDYTRNIDDLYFSKYSNSSLKVIRNNERIATISFNYGAASELSKGDSVELTADFDAEIFENLGYIIPADKTNISVPDLGEYITSKSQLTTPVVEALKEKITSEREPKEICEIYYATYKPGIECSYNSTSFIVPVIYKSGFWSSSTGYFVDSIFDVIIKPDGSIECNYKSDSWNDYDSLEEAQEAFSTDKYTFDLIYTSTVEAEESAEETEETEETVEETEEVTEEIIEAAEETEEAAA